MSLFPNHTTLSLVSASVCMIITKRRLSEGGFGKLSVLHIRTATGFSSHTLSFAFLFSFFNLFLPTIQFVWTSHSQHSPFFMLPKCSTSMPWCSLIFFGQLFVYTSFPSMWTLLRLSGEGGGWVEYVDDVVCVTHRHIFAPRRGAAVCNVLEGLCGCLDAGMFAKSAGLSSAPKLPAGWLAGYLAANTNYEPHFLHRARSNVPSKLN